LSAIVFCCKKWHNLFGARILLPAAIMFLLRRRARELSCNMTGPAKTKPQLQVLLITSLSLSLSLSLSTLLCFHLSLLFLQKINCELLPDEPTVSLHQCCLLLAPPLGILFSVILTISLGGLGPRHVAVISKQGNGQVDLLILDSLYKVDLLFPLL